MTTKKIRVALIGYGWWGSEAFAPAILNDDRADIVAVCAQSASTQAKAKTHLGQQLNTYSSVTELLNNETLDAAFVSTPDPSHQQILEQLLNTNTAIYFEPPASHLRKNLQDMLEKLRTAKQLIHTDTELIYAPVFTRAITLLHQEKKIGDIQQLHMRLNAAWGPFPDCDISLMNQLAPWYADIICRLIGSLPQRVLVMDGREAINGRRQNQSQALFDFNSVSAIFSANVAAAVEQDETHVVIQGSNGELHINYFTGQLQWRTCDQPQWHCETISPQQPIAGWPGMQESVQDFFNHLISGGKTQNNPQRLAQMCAIGAAAEQSKDSGEWQNINP